MANYGITHVNAYQYRYKDYRYSKLSDAIAQTRRTTVLSIFPKHQGLTMVPGMAIRPAENRSLAEKCGPAQKMRRITPISASFSAIPASRTKPGADRDTGQKITGQRKQLQPARYKAADEGGYQSHTIVVMRLVS